MSITHTYYKCTQSNRLKNKYRYTITYINLQSNLCNSNFYTWHIRNAINATILAESYVT